MSRTCGAAGRLRRQAERAGIRSATEDSFGRKSGMPTRRSSSLHARWHLTRSKGTENAERRPSTGCSTSIRRVPWPPSSIRSVDARGHALADQDGTTAGAGRRPARYPNAPKPEGMEEAHFYWSFVEFGLKTVLLVHHVGLYPLPGDGTGPLALAQPADLRQPLLSECAGSPAAGRRPGAAGTAHYLMGRRCAA